MKTISVSDETYEAIKDQLKEKETGTDIKHKITGKVLFHVDSANLEDANLRDANLRDADLRNANLEGADLRGANLRGADLRNANLVDADLVDAKTIGCNVNFSSSEYEQAKHFIEGLKKI